jgi:hypothetical protein
MLANTDGFGNLTMDVFVREQSDFGSDLAVFTASGDAIDNPEGEA